MDIVNLEDIVVFGFVLLGFLGIVGSLYLLARLNRIFRGVIILLLLFINSSIGERLCRFLFHDQARGAIWTRIMFITIAVYISYTLTTLMQHRDAQSIEQAPPQPEQKEGIAA